MSTYLLKYTRFEANSTDFTIPQACPPRILSHWDSRCQCSNFVAACQWPRQYLYDAQQRTSIGRPVELTFRAVTGDFPFLL